MATQQNQMWKVVGGKDKGGILVREEKDTSSLAFPERLSAGALVRVQNVVGHRLFYELVKGTGPHSGWVSTQIGNTILMAPAENGDSDDDSNHELAAVSDSEASTQDTPRAAVEATGGSKVSASMAMQEYMHRFGKDSDQDPSSRKDHKRTSVPNSGKVQIDGHDSQAHQQVRDQLARELSTSKNGKEPIVLKKSSKLRPAFALLAGNDDNTTLCRHCQLPIGDVAYNGPNGVGIYHGECMAQHLLHEMRDEELVRKQKVLDEKKARHEEYAIGWTPEAVPANAGPAEKLACRVVPEGMCCLVLQEHADSDCSIRVAATVEPAASVNLEYLSLALEVRRREGREPLFSLDPVDPTDKKTMQGKRFEPEWLAGTSLGEVMFQADYQLKELSMGEYEQPVMGMKSCFDYAEAEDTSNAWNAREWFMVKDADVQMSADNVLLPLIKMGVEAREQIITENGMQDTAMTRKNHPLVKYAEAFTQNFDLIAERKSAVFHLREAAKASILAKFLLESNVNLEESWFNLATMQDHICPMEVPQLWNERVYSQIHVKDGTIVDAEKGIGSSTRGIYGGVEFALPAISTAPGGRPKVAAGMGRIPGLSQPPARGTVAPASRGVQPLSGLRVQYSAMSRLMSMAPKPEVGIEVPTLQVRKPEGVDLNLDAFSLSQATRVQLEAQEASQSLDLCMTVGSAFWATLEKEKGGFKPDDRALLQAVFNPKLSDRREEGDRFVPPDPSPQYVSKLRKLVKNEELLSAQRKEQFCSKTFARSHPGESFPASWTSTFEMAHGELQTKSLEGSQHSSLLQHRPDYKAEAHMFEDCIKSTVPVFDKIAEDGTRFRIYQFGTIEVRSMQELNASEELVAVFSVRSPTHTTVMDRKDWLVGETEHFAKVTEYVERDAGETAKAGKVKRRYFIVLETQRGNLISTEMFEDGRMKWEENPDDLEDRISLAKVLRTINCQGKSNTVRNLKMHMMMEAKGAVASADKSKCKRYAQIAFFHAQGFREADINQPNVPEVPTTSAVNNVPGADEVKHEGKPARRKHKLDMGSLGLMSTNLMMPSNR